MRGTHFYILMLSFNLIIGCKSTAYKKVVYPNIPIELQFLSNFQTNIENNSDQIIIEYQELKLREVIKKSNSEFWIDDKKLLTVAKNSFGYCYIREVFKKNFLLVSKGNCGAAGPDLIARNDVILVDLNSYKRYHVDFGEFMLTRSKKVVDELYNNSDKYSAIVDIDIEKDVIRIINNKIGIKAIAIIPQNN